MTRTFDPIELEICWQSLIATVNEQARALQRSAFSPIVREAGDLANAVFDRRGRMVAQAVTGTPGHINSLAMAVVNILEEYPLDSLEEGDVLITNDPYKTAGQLLDVTVLVPVWRGGQIIALFGSTIHHTDVGGYGIGAGGRDVFEEGLWIPIVKLMRRGERNDDVWKLILSNVRQPDHMAGDLHAQMASGEVGAQRLLSLCDQHGLDDIEDLADEIIDRSEAATRAGIRELQAGTYHSSAMLDLADGSRIEIRCALTVDTDTGTIIVDYTGSADASPWGINVVKNYTHAYTTFTVRSVLSPEIPNNHGSLAPIEMIAPEGSIVNAVSPQPCTARHVVGMFLPNALLKALAQVRPDGAMAEGSGAVWTMQVSGNHDDGSPFITAMFTYAGGVGARSTKPGLDACSYPTGVAAVPIEVVEASAPIRFTTKALRQGSGGAGAQTGGLGQTIEFEVDTTRAWQLNAVTSRLAEPPLGIFGGEPGASGAFSVNGEAITTQARITLQPGDVVRLDLPGGEDSGPLNRTTRTGRPNWPTRQSDVVDDIGSTTFTGLWDRAVEQYGSRPFLQFESTSGDVRRWTYAEFAAVVDGVAGVFHAHGVTPSRWRPPGRHEHPVVRRGMARRGSAGITHRAVGSDGHRTGARRTHPPHGPRRRAAGPHQGLGVRRRAGRERRRGCDDDRRRRDRHGDRHRLDRAHRRRCAESERSLGRHVHERHDRPTQGRRHHPGQLRVRRHGNGRGLRAHLRGPPARRAPAVPRQRPVLLVRLGDRRRCIRRADAHLLGERVRRSGGATRRHPREPFAGPMRMILARGGPVPRRGAITPAAPLLVRPEPLGGPVRDHLDLVRLPTPPAVRHDRDDSGRAHRPTHRPATRHHGDRDPGLCRRRHQRERRQLRPERGR